MVSASFGGLAVAAANAEGYDRIVVLTDGQWHFSDLSSEVHGSWKFNSTLTSHGDAKVVSPAPLTDKAYMINVATYANGVGYGPWTSIDGWSELRGGLHSGLGGWTGVKFFLVRNIPDAVWIRVKRRAQREGRSIRAVVLRLLGLYASGLVPDPRDEPPIR